MLIVAIDTSGKQGSVALCRGGRESFEVLQITSLEGGTYSAQLMPVIANMLVQNGVAKRDVDGFVVVSGPGSFTGLRVGLATVKGLCEALGKPLATVSMLEAVALVHGKLGIVSAVLDAGRGEIYVGEFQVDDGDAKQTREYLVSAADFVAKKHSAGYVVTPDARVAEALRDGHAGVSLVQAIHADEIGRIGLRKLLTDEVVDAATVDVNYIRRSDAEIFSAPKA
jgi:tRNA threonylcarbamoyladenosine biosynthesis protein TsaB